MATEIAKAYVHLIPSAKGFKNQITSEIGGDVSKAGTESGSDFGVAMVGKIKGLIAAAGIGAIVKEALFAGGDLQQSFGGVDTLYKEAGESVKNYAREAVKAGVSMNDFAEQSVSFGAALKQSLGGDVQAAADAANQAILDMTDNASKMGTDITMVQNAYQGFARGQYMMLDNLKLGYGGTKTEMERLLSDAEKIHEQTTGEVTNYDINNLADVYNAIHDVQMNLGLTGNAAREAETTFTGSFNAMKAATTNLLADLTTGASPEQIATDVSTLIHQALAFVAGNLLPMAGDLIQAIPTVVGTVLSTITQLIETAAADPTAMIDAAINTLTNLAEAILTNLPLLMAAIVKLTIEVAKALISYDWIGAAGKLLKVLAKGLLVAIPTILKTVLKICKDMSDTFVNTDWKTVGINIIKGILNGLRKAAHEILDFMRELANQCLDAIKSALGIHSPSKRFADEVGQWIPKGIGVGVKMYRESALEPMDELSDEMVSTLKLDKFDFKPKEDNNDSGDFNYNQTVNITTTDNDADELARKVKLETMYGLMIDKPVRA